MKSYNSECAFCVFLELQPYAGPLPLADSRCLRDDHFGYACPECVERVFQFGNHAALHCAVGHQPSEQFRGDFGYQAVAKIKIIQNDTFIHSSPQAEFDDKHEKKLVTKEEENYIQSVTENVQNPDLRARLKSLGESIFKNNK